MTIAEFELRQAKFNANRLKSLISFFSSVPKAERMKMSAIALFILNEREKIIKTPEKTKIRVNRSGVRYIIGAHQQILDFIAKNPTPSINQIAKVVYGDERRIRTVNATLQRFLKQNKIKRVNRGRYVVI